MIGAIGASGLTRPVDTLRPDTAAAAAAPKRAGTEVTESVVSNPVAELVALGAPIDADKVERLRAAIAAGSYAVDRQAIASAMLAQGLPARA